MVRTGVAADLRKSYDRPAPTEMAIGLRDILQHSQELLKMIATRERRFQASLSDEDRSMLQALGGARLAKACSIIEKRVGNGKYFDAYERLAELRKRRDEIIGGARLAYETERRDLRLEISELGIAIQEAGG